MKVQNCTRVHILKTWPTYFDAILSGAKTFEARQNDRNYAVGDRLHLREWSPEQGYTGRQEMFKVGYILYGGQFGVESGYCVMSLIPIDVPAPPEVLA